MLGVRTHGYQHAMDAATVAGTGIPEDSGYSSLHGSLLSNIKYETRESCCRHAKDRSQRMVVIPH